MMFGRRPLRIRQESRSGTLRRSEATASEFDEAVIEEIRHGHDAGAGKFREITVVVIAAPGFIGPFDGIADERGETDQLAGDRRQGRMRNGSSHHEAYIRGRMMKPADIADGAAKYGEKS